MATETIKTQIQEQMKAAMRSQDKERLSTIRLILSALKQREVDERIVLTDEHILGILDKMVKQRRESVVQFETGNRPDLVQKEMAEIKVIQEFMPTQLSETEIHSFIEMAIKESGATSARDMGKVMAVLKPKLQGRADMTAASAKIKERLALL